MSMVQTIKFYKKDDPYGFMSNFYKAEVEVDGEVYKTSEHYYQCMKFEDPDLREWVKNIPTPHIAFKLSRFIGWEEERLDWPDVKEDIMRKVVELKFRQHPELMKQLLETGNSILVEDSPVDEFWGCGESGIGKNRLGHILMDVRDKYAEIIITRK